MSAISSREGSDFRRRVASAITVARPCRNYTGFRTREFATRCISLSAGGVQRRAWFVSGLFAAARPNPHARSAFPRDEPLLAGRGAKRRRRSRRRFRNHDRAFVRSGAAARARPRQALGLSSDCRYRHSTISTAGAGPAGPSDEVASAEPDAWQAWLTDPEAAPHGGESIADLVQPRRRHSSMPCPREARSAVTHAAVDACAQSFTRLSAPAIAFWQIDIAPLAEVRLHGEERPLAAPRHRPAAGPPLAVPRFARALRPLPPPDDRDAYPAVEPADCRVVGGQDQKAQGAPSSSRGSAASRTGHRPATSATPRPIRTSRLRGSSIANRPTLTLGITRTLQRGPEHGVPAPRRNVIIPPHRQRPRPLQAAPALL